MIVASIIVAVIAYLIGSINFAVLISKKMAGFDVREKGSRKCWKYKYVKKCWKKSSYNNFNM